MTKKNRPAYSKNVFNPFTDIPISPEDQDIVPDLINKPTSISPPTNYSFKTRKAPSDNSFFKKLLGVEDNTLISPYLQNKYLLTSLPDGQILAEYTDSYTDSIHMISGKKVNIKDNISYKKKKILVLSLIQNCSRSIDYIKKFISELSIKTLKTNFYFFTNNNIDKSEDILKEWIKNDNTIHGVFGPQEAITIKTRHIKLAEYRETNLVKALDHFGKDFDYIIIFDSDISDTVNTQAVLDSISRANSLEPWSIVSSNSCYKESEYYYDQFALRLLGQGSDIAEIYPRFNEFFGHTPEWINTIYLFDKGMVEVSCCFGGICIYKAQEIINILKTNKEVYSLKDYPDGTCEHIPLCNILPNKKYIDSDLKYFHPYKLEGHIVQHPMIFIPRDAGFFSVFNFYIGSLSSGSKIYPYFNKDIFLKVNNNTNKHFAYWTDKDNCWFDYFDPIKFYDDDDTHMSPKTLMSLAITKGENNLAPRVFTHPEMTRALINDQESFNKWRKYINSFYIKYIKFNPEIIKQADSFWNNNTLTDETIGVHYRHPSHSVESGKIYLKQYFDEIDKILDVNDSSIFLASDNKFGILAFKDRYKDKIKYIEDIKRLDMDNFLEWGFALMNKKEIDENGFIDGFGMELHHKSAQNTECYSDNKKMTIDLLKEVICLSKCKSLIYTQSNIPLAISYMNPELDMILLNPT